MSASDENVDQESKLVLPDKDKVEKQMQRHLAVRSGMRALVLSLLVLIIYVSIGVTYYCLTLNLSILESIYFCVVTLTTVGAFDSDILVALY